MLGEVFYSVSLSLIMVDFIIMQVHVRGRDIPVRDA